MAADNWRRVWSALAAGGPASAADLRPLTGLSQPAFSRLLARNADDVLSVGRTRNTRYALRREIAGIGRQVPIFSVTAQGQTRELGRLHPIYSNGFYVEARSAQLEERFFTDIPYFLNDMRPSGFLGRLIPQQHPELALPADVRHWTADAALLFLSRAGFNLPGNLIVGDEALSRYVASVQHPVPGVPRRRRAARYAELARDVLHGAVPGSSAGGEQPKFLVRREDGLELLVKFSPIRGDRVGDRWADLLICEHLAHVALNHHGHAAANSELVLTEDRVFLEIERFDRTSEGGRRGVLSLLSLDAEFVGNMQSWGESATSLIASGRLDASIASEVRCLESFGRLIANSDMHAGNLSFFSEGDRACALAPAYDMLPMYFAPQQSHLLENDFQAPTPRAQDAPHWDSACAAAEDFWSAVAGHAHVSVDFKELARDNLAGVTRARQVGALLPR